MPLSMRLLTGTFMAFMAMVWSSLGVYVWRRYLRLSTKGRLTVGTIMDVEMRSDANGMKWSPKVAFTTSEGQQIIFFGAADEDNRRFIKGRRVNVAYLPENPSEAEVRTGFPWFHLTIIFLLAAGCLIGSVLSYLGFAK